MEKILDVRDGTHDSPKKEINEKYLVTSKNIKNGTINFENCYYISESDYEKINKRSKVSKNDILFTMIGTVGEIAHVIEEPDYAIKNLGLIKTEIQLTSRFVYHYLKSRIAQKYINDNKSRGT